MLTTYHVVSRSRMRSYTPLPLVACMVVAEHLYFYTLQLDHTARYIIIRLPNNEYHLQIVARVVVFPIHPSSDVDCQPVKKQSRYTP
jgi:hypothetical protein